MTIVWHAGEPLVLPIAFYEDAFLKFEELNENRINISHSIQTNGTLITQEWCDFIRLHDIKIGLSIDGPERIHNANRVDRKGQGTFARVQNGMNLLKRNNIDFNVIAVIGNEAIEAPDQIWEFCLENGIRRIAFNSEEKEAAHTESSLDRAGDRETVVAKYKAFFRRLMELQQESRGFIEVREIEFIKSRIRNNTMPGIHHSEHIPMFLISFDCDGNISTFSPELLAVEAPPTRTFVFGNVADSSMETVLANEELLKTKDEIHRGIAICKEACPYFDICGGGAPVNKLCENGSFVSSETLHCSLKIKAVTDAVLEYYEDAYTL